MYKITGVKPLDNSRMELAFNGRETRVFDVKPYLNFGIFNELKNKAYFENVSVISTVFHGKMGKILARKRFT